MSTFVLGGTRIASSGVQLPARMPKTGSHDVAGGEEVGDPLDDDEPLTRLAAQEVSGRQVRHHQADHLEALRRGALASDAGTDRGERSCVASPSAG